MNRQVRALTLAATLLATILGWMLVAAPQEKRPAQTRSQGALTTTVQRPVSVNPPARSIEVVASSPITFADPDGQELILEELSARTVIHEMLSLTELELSFRNPQAKRMEGRFSFALPPGAAISRFAYEINGQLMEGEVVERLRANQVYEQFLHQMRDPALLEQDLGNRFSARIFPIAPHAPVRLLLSYTSLLPAKGGVRTYALPLRGLQKVNKLTFRAFSTPLPVSASSGELTRAAAEVTSFERSDWTPDRDIVLSWQSSTKTPTVLRAGDYYLASLQPRLTARRMPQAAGRWLIYVDTSASAAEGASHRMRALEAMLRALPKRDRVEVVAFDNGISRIASGTATDVAARIGDVLETRLFIGGTDLEAVVRDIARRFEGGETASVVVASDLVPTLGRTASHELQAAIDALPESVRVDALILGNREHAQIARALTRGRGRVLRVPFSERLGERAGAVAAELQRPVGGTLELTERGAEWLHPSRFDDVQPGDEILVLGKLRAGAEPELGQARVVRLDASTFAPLLEREAHRAHLDYLAEREANETSESVRRALAAEQVRISVEQRVVIPRTTMLVLETEWDYQRFGLDRRALAEILTIEAGGIGRIDRTQPGWPRVPRIGQQPVPAPPPMKAAPAVRSQSAAQREERDVAADSAAMDLAVAPPPPPAPVAESITVTSAANVPASGEIVGGIVADPERQGAPVRVSPERRRSETRNQGTEWTTIERPTRAMVESLAKRLRDDPKDREAYNLLGEALAARGDWNDLRDLALAWQPYDPENPQVYELLGMAASGRGNREEAARAFASLIEIGPAKPELLQRAGLLLLRAGKGSIAETPLRRALELRPDRANGYRHLALILWQEGRVEEAARVLESATAQSFPRWYGNVQRIIGEELGYIYRAWLRKAPERRAEIEARARDHRVDLDRADALRVTLVWETDANDVDLHVVDPSGEQCFYGHSSTRSGLALYEDITQGLGPEVIRAGDTERGTYHIGVRYFAAGPMGISRGVVVVMRDGEVELHPFRLTTQGGPVRHVAALTMK